jgi:V/A-type H+-transporting ATPase subunit C
VQRTYERTGDIKSAELELLRRELSLYLELENLVEEEVRGFVHALTGRFEIENLKNALRFWFDHRVRGRNIADAPSYLLRRRIHHNVDLDRIIYADTLEQVAEHLDGTPYAPIVREQATAVMEAASLFPLEVALDHLLYRRLAQGADRLGSRDREIARRLIGVEIDLQNVGWLIRFKDFYSLEAERALAHTLPGGLNFSGEIMRNSYTAEGTDRRISALVGKRYPEIAPLLASQEQAKLSARLTLIERILEQIMTIEVRKILTGYPFTIGIILAYFILKSAEIRKIMTVLNAKFYEWPEDRIMALL